MTDPSEQNTDTQPQQETTPEPKEGRGVQQRIDQLVRQRSEAERTAESATAQTAELKQQLAEMNARLEQLAPQAQQAQSGSKPEVDIKSAIAEALQAQLGPVLESNQQNQLFQQQDAAFLEASSDLPTLRIPNSPERQLFNQLWDARPELHSVPDGPALLVQAVKGLIADGVPSGFGDDARKIAASPPTPSGRPEQRISAIPGNEDPTRTMIQQLKQKAKETGRLTEQERSDLTALQLGVKRVKES